MTAQQTIQSVETADGRILTFAATGDPRGPLLLHNHGGPSSRLEAHLFHDAASRHGLHFVCIDRPGIGRSSRQRTRSFEAWSQDLSTVALSLGYETFGVSGWSEGGPWALGAAAFLDPAQLKHVTNLAGGSYGALGPNWAAPHLSKVDAFGGLLAMKCRPAFRLMYWLLGVTAVHFRATYLKQLRQAANDDDRRILAEPSVAENFGNMSAECFAQGSGGLVRDSLVLYHQWDFNVANIRRTVHFWQGSGDRFVPPVINRLVAERMPGAVWHEVPGAGHLVALGSADEWLQIAAREIPAPR